MTNPATISPLRHILVGLAAQEDLDAKIHYTAELARRHDAKVTLLAVTDVERLRAVGPVPAGAAHHAEHLRESRVKKSHLLTDQAIGEFETAMQGAGVDLTVVRADDDPLDRLARAWRTHDLTILGLKSWFDHTILGAPKDALFQVINRGIRPVLAVPPGHQPVRNVVIFYNGSMESAKSMKQFIRFRLWPDAILHLTCINEPETEEPVHDLLAEAADLCRDHGFDVVTNALKGEVNTVMDAHLHAEKADLLVIGGGFRRILLYKKFGPHILHRIEQHDLPLFISH